MTIPEFTILIDGKCHLCAREARLLARLDGGRGRLTIVDIAAPGFVPASIGKTKDEVMGRIHGVTPDGKVVEGVEVLRLSYRAVGKGWLMNWTGWPGIRSVINPLYRWFARNRMRISRATRWLPGRSEMPLCTTDRCRIR
jgi:predicted DCC family thiol-disulfide oxidoreductase YuxK